MKNFNAEIYNSIGGGVQSLANKISGHSEFEDMLQSVTDELAKIGADASHAILYVPETLLSYKVLPNGAYSLVGNQKYHNGGVIDISPMADTLIRTTLAEGYITIDDAFDRSVRLTAEEVAERWSDAEEIGSSDRFFMMKEFLDDLGYQTSYDEKGKLVVAGQIQRYETGGETDRYKHDIEVVETGGGKNAIVPSGKTEPENVGVILANGGSIDDITPRDLGNMLKSHFENNYNLDVRPRYIRTVRGLDNSWFEITTYRSKQIIPNSVRKELLELSTGKSAEQAGVLNLSDINYGNIQSQRIAVFGRDWKKWLKSKQLFAEGGAVDNGAYKRVDELRAEVFDLTDESVSWFGDLIDLIKKGEKNGVINISFSEEVKDGRSPSLNYSAVEKQLSNKDFKKAAISFGKVQFVRDNFNEAREEHGSKYVTFLFSAEVKIGPAPEKKATTIQGMTFKEALFLWVKKAITQKYREAYLSPAGLNKKEEAEKVQQSLIKLGYLNSAGAITPTGKASIVNFEKDAQKIFTQKVFSDLYYSTPSYNREFKYDQLKKMFEYDEEEEYGNGGTVKTDKTWVSSQLKEINEWYKDRLKYAKKALSDAGFNQNHRRYELALDTLNKVKDVSQKLVKSGILDNGNIRYRKSFTITREGYADSSVIISNDIVWRNPKFVEEWGEYKKKYENAADRSAFAADKIGELTHPILGFPLGSSIGYTYEGSFIGKSFGNGGKVKLSDDGYGEGGDVSKDYDVHFYSVRILRGGEKSHYLSSRENIKGTLTEVEKKVQDKLKEQKYTEGAYANIMDGSIKSRVYVSDIVRYKYGGKTKNNARARVKSLMAK